MNHILGAFLTLITMVSKYLTVAIIFLFDALVFSYPLMWVNNNVLVENYSIPTLQFLDVVGMIFSFKIITLLWKSVNIASNITDDEVKEE